jgi:hypothetical protein
MFESILFYNYLEENKIVNWHLLKVTNGIKYRVFLHCFTFNLSSFYPVLSYSPQCEFTLGCPQSATKIRNEQFYRKSNTLNFCKKNEFYFYFSEF